MTLNKITKILLKIIASILVIAGILSLLKGCSPEWTGQEGGAAIGGALQSISFSIHGVFLLIMAGWAIALYKASTTKNKVTGIFATFISMFTGLVLLYSGVLNYNPFTRSNSQVMYLIPGEFVGFLSITIFILIGINAFASVTSAFKNKS